MSISPESFLELEPVLGALSEAAGEVQQKGPGRWTFPAGPEEALQVTARVDQEWILMDKPLAVCEGGHSLQPKRLWKLLHANAALSGGAKFAVAGSPRSVRRRAEIRVMDEIDLPGRIRNACLGFQEALPRFYRKTTGRSLEGAEPLGAATHGDSDGHLQALCTEAGWACSVRPGGGVAVRLDVQEGFYQATVRSGSGGSLDVWLELANEASWPSKSWKALGIFLLQACGHLKTVRAVARNLDSGAATAGFQVFLDPPVGSEELGRAFTALSAACSLVGKEVKILREEVVGKEYLAMVREWSSRPCRTKTKEAPSGENRRGKE